MKTTLAILFFLICSCGDKGSKSKEADSGVSTPSKAISLPSEADVEMYLSAGDSGFSDGDPVSQWDAIGSTVSATQPTPGSEPIFQVGSGEPDAVAFDGVDDFLIVDASDVDISNGLTIIMATKVNIGAEQYLLSRGYDGETRYRFYFNASGMLMYNYTNGGSSTTSNVTSAIADQTWVIITLKLVVTDSNQLLAQGRVNGVTNGSNSSGPHSWPAITRDLILGAKTPSAGVYTDYLDASIAQMVMYDSDLSDSEIEEIECSLSEAYEIAVNQSCT